MSSNTFNNLNYKFTKDLSVDQSISINTTTANASLQISYDNSTTPKTFEISKTGITSGSDIIIDPLTSINVNNKNITDVNNLKFKTSLTEKNVVLGDYSDQLYYPYTSATGTTQEMKISKSTTNDININTPGNITFNAVSYTHLTLPTKRIV